MNDKFDDVSKKICIAQKEIQAIKESQKNRKEELIKGKYIPCNAVEDSLSICAKYTKDYTEKISGLLIQGPLLDEEYSIIALLQKEWKSQLEDITKKKEKLCKTCKSVSCKLELNS